MTLFRTQIMVQHKFEPRKPLLGRGFTKFSVNLIELLGVGETGAPRGKPTIDPLLAN